MDNTNKNSIAAIVFTIIFLLFVIFISLFRGITLYDIKANNLKIGNIFLKINKKIILKINNIQILPSDNYNKQNIEIDKIIYKISKILPFFETIEINNLHKNDMEIIKKLKIDQNRYLITTPFFKSSGKITLKNNNLSLLSTMSIFNIKINKFILKAHLDQNKIKGSVKGLSNKENFDLKFNLNGNKLNFSGKVKNLIYQTGNLHLNGKNIKTNGYINILNSNIFVNLFAPSLKLKNSDFSLNSFNNYVNINNNYIFIKAQKDYLQNNSKTIKAKNSTLYFYLPQQLVLIHSDNTQLNYLNYTLNSNNSELDYNLKNQNIFFHTNNIKLNNDINVTAKEALFIKNKDFYYVCEDNRIIQRYFDLKTDLIKGDLNKISISDIFGKVLIFNFLAKKPLVNITDKTARCDKIIFNGINFTDNKFNFSKKPFIFSSHTNTLFNQNVKDILNYFKINIPFVQTNGINDLNFSINTDLKNINVNYLLSSKDSNFSINPKNRFFYKQLQVKGDLNQSNIIFNNFGFKNDTVDSLLDGNLNINIDKKYLNAFLFIKKLKIDDYIDIKNFYDKLVIDLIKKYAYLLNSYIFIDLKQKTIYLYNLKSLLKYSILKEIFQNGQLIIKLLNNETDIYAKTLLNYPFILNQKNPKSLKAHIILKDNNVIIKNKFIDTQILHFEKIISYIKNINIDIEGLINIIKTTNKLAHKKEKSNKPVDVVILSNNTNFIYKGHKFLTDQATLTINKELNFTAKYKKSSLMGYTKDNYLLLEGKNYNKESLIPLFNFFDHFNYINTDFVTVKSPDNFYTGKIYIKKASIKDLAALNNIIAFVNTIPALLSLKTPGFSAKGYKIKKGFVSYLFYNNILYFKQINIKGVNLDFRGKGYIDLNKNKIKLKIETIVKIKLKNIPILGKALSYLFFGKDGYLHINIFVKGNLNNPKVSKDLGGSVIETPFILFKRIITLPFNIF